MFIVQHNLMNDVALSQVSSALQKLNIPHKFVGVIPFSHEITSDEPLEGQEFIPYGSTLMTNLTGQTNLQWRGNYFDPSTFHYGVWLKHRSDMLNSGVMTIAEAIQFLKSQDSKSVWFTRPCEDLKQYSGQVIEAEDCCNWLKDAIQCESSGSYKLEPDTEIILCQPKNIQAEWRWFVVNGQVVSGSMYRFKGQLQKAEELDPYVIREAQYFADDWLPHRNCVMDLALVDGEMKVIEFNTINSSGFYDHNVEMIISELWKDFNERRK